MVRFSKFHLLPPFILASVILSYLAGCGSTKTLVMYHGERRPPEQVAVIDISAKSLFVMGIDSLARRYEALSEDQIEVTPGEHTLVVHYGSWKGRSGEPWKLNFTAIAGHSYKVLVSAGYRRWTAWIVDLENGSVVAGNPDM